MPERVSRRDSDEGLAHIIHDQAFSQIHTSEPGAVCKLAIYALCLYTIGSTVGTKTWPEAC